MKFKKYFITAVALAMMTVQAYAVGFTVEQAKNIAMGYVPKESTIIHTEQENGKFEFKLYNQKDETFYEIEISTATQKPISFEAESIYHTGSTIVSLSEQNIKDIVLKEIPQAQFVTVYLDSENGFNEYKAVFYTTNFTGEYHINAQNGMILQREIKFQVYQATTYAPVATQTPIQTPVLQTPVIQTPIVQTPTQTNLITIEQAKQIALSKAPNAVLHKIKLDKDDGILIYEGEMKQGNIEYEFEIDAITGAILDWDVDID